MYKCDFTIKCILVSEMGGVSRRYIHIFCASKEEVSLKKEQMELGRVKKDGDKLLMHNTVLFYIPNSLWSPTGIHVCAFQRESGIHKCTALYMYCTSAICFHPFLLS